LQRLAVYKRVSGECWTKNSINGEIQKVCNSRHVNKAV